MDKFPRFLVKEISGGGDREIMKKYVSLPLALAVMALSTFGCMNASADNNGPGQQAPAGSYSCGNIPYGGNGTLSARLEKAKKELNDACKKYSDGQNEKRIGVLAAACKFPENGNSKTIIENIVTRSKTICSAAVETNNTATQACRDYDAGEQHVKAAASATEKQGSSAYHTQMQKIHGTGQTTMNDVANRTNEKKKRADKILPAQQDGWSANDPVFRAYVTNLRKELQAEKKCSGLLAEADRIKHEFENRIIPNSRVGQKGLSLVYDRAQERYRAFTIEAGKNREIAGTMKSVEAAQVPILKKIADLEKNVAQRQRVLDRNPSGNNSAENREQIQLLKRKIETLRLESGEQL